MNTKVLNVLEYRKIIDLLMAKCETPLGKNEAEKLVPLDTIESINLAQSETGAALSRIYAYGSVSCSGTRDIREALLRLKIGSNLGIVELLNIKELLRTALRVRQYGVGEDRENKDALDPYFAQLEPVIPLYRELERTIESEETLYDDASPNLKSIRRKLKITQDKVHDELNRLVVSNGSYLRENVITMRNGRYCIPVKSEYRSQVQGMIHDESGSGSTVFIEPMSVVRLNNEIRELEIAEQKEIEVILAALSELASTHYAALNTDLHTLSHLDFVFAKGALAKEMDATCPIFNMDHRIRLKQARHPLLQKKKVVPIDVVLGEDFHQLIVTGPNTGGKTVSLKTVGLLTLMGEAGLHIPAFSESELGFFSEVYADIGDEQSIEQNLSTFSSHMKNITGILDHCDSDSLVLFDELCAGTDPTEGAALAMAILNFLHRMQVRTMATTHYSELKLYALSEEGVENASCEFDVATLSPTYHLLIGIPGKSNAFAISRKLGLPGFIIDEAKTRIDGDSERFEDVLKNLDDSRRKMEREKSRIGQLKKEAKDLKESLSKQESRIDEQKEKIIREAKEEARKILAEAKAQVDESIRAMNKAGNDVRELEKVRTKTREMLNKNIDAEKKTEKAEKKSKTKSDELHVGDKVLVHSMNMEGIVNTLPDARGNLYVQLGILRTYVNISDITKLEDKPVEKQQKGSGGHFSSIGVSKAMSISTEINLIGKTVDEAIPDLDKYLDDAYLSGLPKVRIVHGRGTGALKNAVHQKLRKVKYVKAYRLGEFGEGDSGVTIVEFK